MKRLQRRWHRLLWCLLLPALGAAPLFAAGFQPATLVNPNLSPALANAVVETPPPDATPTAKTP
jgi:hypothetical protein